MANSHGSQAWFREFFRGLRKDAGVVRCGTIYVDVAGTIDRQVACGDGLCWESSGRAAANSRAITGKTCCTTFMVPVQRPEIARIRRILPEVRKIRDVGAAIDRAGGFFHEEAGSTWMNDRPNGACVFLSSAPGGPPLCSIHEWAASKGEDHRAWKPENCCLFPLYLVQWGEDTFVTSYGSERWRAIDPAEAEFVKSYACFTPPAGRGHPVLVEQEAELRFRIGARRWNATLRKLRGLGHNV